jgi:hypothetical protein
MTVTDSPVPECDFDILTCQSHPTEARAPPPPAGAKIALQASKSRRFVFAAAPERIFGFTKVRLIRDFIIYLSMWQADFQFPSILS